MKRQNIRTLSLIVCTFTYLLVGAAIFDALESEHEILQKNALIQIEGMIRSKYNMSNEDFRILTTIVIKSVPHKAGVQWKFAGAFYFATTVLTTIGYGHSTPATWGGKMFCMFYALAGIPLGLVMFQSIGERLNTFVAFSLKFCKKLLKMKKVEVTETNLIIFVGLSSCLVMTTGALVFAHFEKWSLFDSLYFSFITLTTIGFGDYVALQKDYALQSKPEYVVFSLVFILFGLSVVSAAINLLVLRFLTLNTEDERRDEAEAALTAAGRVRLEGDVITGNDGSIASLDDGNGLPPESDNLETASVCSCTCYGKPMRRKSFLIPNSGRRDKGLLRRESSSLRMIAVSGPEGMSNRSGGTIFDETTIVQRSGRKASTFSTSSAAPAFYRHYLPQDEDEDELWTERRVVQAIEEEDLPSGSYDSDLYDFKVPQDSHLHNESGQEDDCHFDDREYDFVRSFNRNEGRSRNRGSHFATGKRKSSHDSGSTVDEEVEHQLRRSRQQVSGSGNRKGRNGRVNSMDADHRSGRGWRKYTPSAILRSMTGKQQSSSSSSCEKRFPRGIIASGSSGRGLITFTDSSSYDGNHRIHAFTAIPLHRRHKRNRDTSGSKNARTKTTTEKTSTLITLNEDPDLDDYRNRLKRASI